jgi:hypothetical protein
VNKKNSLILAGILIVVIAAISYQIVQTRNNNEAADAALQQTVENDTLGLSFSYKGGPDGFTLVEPPAEQKGILKAYLLLPTKAYEEYKTKEVPSEAPAGMNVFVFTHDEATTTDAGASTTPRADRMTRLQEWATTNTTITSFTMAKAAPETVEIDGLKMLRYKADGLYQQDIYLASYKNQIYMFVGQYNEESDMTYTEFQTLMQTVSFD